MADDAQTFPLAHFQAHHKSDEEQQKNLKTFHALRKERSNKCFIYVFAALVLLAVAVLVFALIVLRVTSPTIHLSALSVARFSLGSNSSSLDLTLAAQYAVDNSNFGPFNFDGGSVGFLYGGAVIGERVTGGGRAEAKGTKTVNVTVEGFAKNVSADSRNLGVLNLSGFVRLRGRVRLIHVFRKRISSEIRCSVNLDLNSHRILPGWVCD